MIRLSCWQDCRDVWIIGFLQEGDSFGEVFENVICCGMVLVSGEKIGNGEDGHTCGFPRLEACNAVFEYGAPVGFDVQSCCGFEIDFGVGFGVGDVAA